MPRDYDNDVDWKGAYPSERVALGLLGIVGFRNMKSKKFLRDHFGEVRTKKSKLPTLAAFGSRMDHGARYISEMKWLQTNRPWYFNQGVRVAAALMKIMIDQGIQPLIQEISSPGPSAKLATEVNRLRKKVKDTESKLSRPKGDKRIVT